MKKIVNLLKLDISEFIAWVKKNEPKYIADITKAINIVEEIRNDINSSKFETVEQYLEKYIPMLKGFEVTISPILEEVIKLLMQLKSSTIFVNSISLTLASIILGLLDGNSKDQATYVSDIQTVFSKNVS